MAIVALERMFDQLDVWGQDPEDLRFVGSGDKESKMDVRREF